MPELRRDPLLSRWVIIAEERRRRPGSKVRPGSGKRPLDPAKDPFAEGNERYTPAEIYAIRAPGSQPNGPGWRVRVFPNKYPALRVEGELAPHGHGIYDRMNGIGAHEVLVETPDPHAQLADLHLNQIVDIVSTYRQRIEDLSRDQRMAYVLAFKNHGEAAGATQRHSHSQIIAMPMVPTRVQAQLAALDAHWKLKRRSLFSDILEQELLMQERVVFENKHVLAYCPFASSFPFEIQILPKVLRAEYHRCSEEELRGFAEALKVCLLKWRAVLGDIAYNYVLYSAPNNTPMSGIHEEYPLLGSYFSWHVEMFPRLTMPAGFEWGTGYYINTVSPENAARALGEAEVSVE